MLVRVAHPKHRLARLAAAIAALPLLALPVASGCRARSDQPAWVRIDARVLPLQPTVGRVTETVSLSGATVDTLAGARVDVVAHMTHPGMTPVVATVTRRGPDVFEAALDLDLAGDWELVATAQLPDGRRVESRTPVRVLPRQP
jgi:hypothetical protein